ncbi:hypothetical protein N7466_006253 [Penicillium verhagenii]|uniref:uncharacterized protein n=1 Tax=Penicillium verhagenii TaxID=1562060 RepID=UPI00254526CE|nr:uncharacterized protein N7466_006253 [Penicillium verhagenii]KAJ5930760.1 hypothetical protein N7466_006253 [Penicillium verhagenii]
MARHGKSKARMKRAPAMAKPSPPQFTMQQEARNTETHTRSWSHSNLRHKAVQFVSAGQLQRTESNIEEEEGSQIEETPSEVAEPEYQAPPDAKEDASDELFILDTAGEEVVHTGLPDPTLKIDSSDTEGSEDEVVFMGRRRPIMIETDEKELREYFQMTRSAASPEGVQHTDNPTVAKTQTIQPTRQRHNQLPEGKTHTLEDAIFNTEHDQDQQDAQIHAEAEGGIEVGNPLLGSELATEGSQSIHTQISDSHLEQNSPNSQPIEDAEVLGSIDVLSKMYLDTEPDSSCTSEDDDAELDSLDESDEDLDDMDDDMDDEGLLEELAISYSAGKKGGRGQHAFLSATAFADALDADPYYGLDIMDFDRPSLQKRPKGKKTRLPEDLLLPDSDLDSIDLEILREETWEADRKKKKAKKQEREELRSQGLLGRKFADPDLKVKYAKGMDLEDLISEIRTFLLSSKTSLALPPMTKHRRKTIHELANKVNLKSQSRGNGLTRFPVLLKTSRTPKYTRKTIPQFDNLLSGRKLNRRLYQSWGPDASRPAKAKRSGAGAGGAVSYMDGDVVGASAPEIGVGNRGRAMLEKMGWSSGTALGASNNKGILLPVAQVVKNSRAGLG